MVNFMVAVDGSQHADRAFYLALRMVQPGRKDHLFVVTVSRLLEKNKFLDEETREEQNRKVVYQARELLGKYEAQCQRTQVPYTCLARAGKPRYELMRLVDEMHVHYLVLGTRGLGMTKRVFLGSVSDYMVKHAKCSILVAK